MPKSFRDSVAVELMKLSRDAMREAKIGHHEIDVLMLFYDEKNKVRRRKLAKFSIYARVCEDALEDSWALLMNKADAAILTLIQVGLIQRTTSTPLGAATSTYVGRASEVFELTANGYERLQTIHPNLALRLKGWVAVAPPWLVLFGTVCSGISGLWGILMSLGIVG